MTLISFPESTGYDFAMQFVQGTNTALLGLKPRSHHLEIEANNPVVGRLLQRISEKQPVVFPYVRNTTHSWLITAKTRRQLDLMSSQISRFIVPTYAEFASSNRLPELKAFKKDGNRLQQLGAALYPAGYYSWRSPAKYFNDILRHLDMWMNLEEECPSFQTEQHPTYRSLHDIFEAALAAGNWREAEQCLQEMQDSYLITADNLAFLQVQLLAQQQRWLDIWKRPDFANLARMRMPRSVRTALLTAFHYSVILPLEQQEQWKVALEAFKQERAKLGLLLTGRFGLVQAPVVQVYAYQAATDKDAESLARLSEVSPVKEVQVCIDWLQRLADIDKSNVDTSSQEADRRTTSKASSLRLARLALAELDYDSALRFAREVMQPEEKVVLLMQIAFHSSDVPVAEEALLSYWDLSIEEQAQLEATYSFLPLYVKYLLEITDQQPSAPSTPPSLPIQDWLEWFDLAERDPNNPELMAALDRLAVTIDDRYWNQEKVKLLSDKLLSFIIEPHSSYAYTKIVIQKLVDFFLQDEQFPREEDAYSNLYETLYVGLLEKQEVNQTVGLTLLRLAEAILRRSPSQSERICENLKSWCKTAIPALENWVLEVFDLLAEYGLAHGLLVDWYRDWLTHLLNLPGIRERANLETWLIFGQWIQPGYDLLNQLQRALTIVTDRDVDDPISHLPIGYRISIFSLRELSTARARQILLERNKNLDIRICFEKDLNPQAKALAQNSDLVVIVTTCMSHALTYGIGPYLKKEPVYPQASGSTSIVRSIEEHIRKR